jgi:hypothetical protein
VTPDRMTKPPKPKAPSARAIPFGARLLNLFWLDPGSPEDIAIQLTEGRILGCSPTL